jgi:tRNA nucleotidyltransferase (CCA-adding enzyme)
VGQSFPVYHYTVDSTTFEIACCRTEKKVGTGHQGFEVEVCSSFEQDAWRRDLTINTMWYGDNGLAIFDPVVAHHVGDRVLEAVTDAFAEDPLRVLRVARFHAQLGPQWTLGTRVRALMTSLKDELKTLAPDRIRCELEKAMMSNHPRIFFDVLRETDCLGYWFPEVEAMIGVDHNIKHHPEGDVYNHQMLVLQRARELGCNYHEMLCALGHDFGKPCVPKDLWPKMHNHESLGATPIENFCARLGLGQQIQNQMKTVAFYHTTVHTIDKLRAITKVRMILSLRRMAIGVKGMASVCQADAQGRGTPFDTQAYPQAQTLLELADKMSTVKFDGVPDMSREKAESMYVRALKG